RARTSLEAPASGHRDGTIKSSASYPARAMERPSSEVWRQPAGARKSRRRIKLAVPVRLLALTRNGVAMAQYYHRERRENRKPEADPAMPQKPGRTPPSRVTPPSRENQEPSLTPPSLRRPIPWQRLPKTKESRPCESSHAGAFVTRPGSLIASGPPT